MDQFVEQLASLCRAHVTRSKWVFVPSHALGRTIGERIALEGTNWLNLRFVTPLDIALRMAQTTRSSVFYRSRKDPRAALRQRMRSSIAATRPRRTRRGSQPAHCRNGDPEGANQHSADVYSATASTCLALDAATYMCCSDEFRCPFCDSQRTTASASSPLNACNVAN
jgi:hypothetical protein